MDAESVFEILVRENADMLLAYLRSVVAESSAVDDLFQETMLVAWRRLPDFDRKRPFGAWIRGIAANLVKAHFRKTASEQPLEDSHLEWLSSRFDRIHERSGDTFSQKIELLDDCMAELPESYRAPIELKFRGGLDLAEIVSRLGSNLETIKKRLTRAKSRLADCIDFKLGLSEGQP